MKAISKICTVLAIVFLSIAQFSFATTPKNLIHGQWSLEEVKQMLVMNQEWVRFPQYSDRQGWDKVFGRYKEKAIKDGEKCLDYQWEIIKATDYLAYRRTGNRVIMQEPYFRNFKALSQLLIAEMAEGKGRFIDHLINGVFHTCEMSSWALSAHLVAQPSHHAFPYYDYDFIDIFAGDASNVLSYTYYFLHNEFDKIEPEISRRLYHELDKRILTPFLNNHYWWMTAGSNWNAWTSYNSLLTFMLLENDKDRLAEGVYKSMKCIDHFFNYIHEDGACEEGPHYWSSAHAKAFEYLELLRDITGGGIDLLKEPKVKNMGEYIAHCCIGNNWVVNFADASARGDHNPFYVYRFGKATNSTLMQHFAANELKCGKRVKFDTTDINGFLRSLYVQDELATTDTTLHIEPMVWYPQTELCYLRNGKALLAAKGGHNAEVHNHNDVGSFVFAVNKVPVFIDAGNGTYDSKTFSSARYSIWNMSSLYHNVPAINGFAQKAGGRHKAQNVKVAPCHFQLDLTKVYPAEAKVSDWTRSYYLKSKELIIKDKFELTETVAPNQINFLTRGEVTLTDGKINIKVKGAKVSLKYDKHLFDTKMEKIKLNDPLLSRNWGDHIYRISLTAKKMAKTGSYTYRISY